MADMGPAMVIAWSGRLPVAIANTMQLNTVIYAIAERTFLERMFFGAQNLRMVGCAVDDGSA